MSQKYDIVWFQFFGDAWGLESCSIRTCFLEVQKISADQLPGQLSSFLQVALITENLLIAMRSF